MTDEPRDELDDALTRGLQSLAPNETQLDADATLAGMRPRLTRARSRHRYAMTGAALALVAVLAAATALVATRPDSHSSVQTPVASLPDGRRSDTARSTTTRPATTTPSTTRGGTTRATSHDTTQNSTPASTPATSPMGNGGNATPGATPGTTPATTPAVDVRPSTKTYTTAGGSVTVRLQNPHVTLLSFAAAPGYTGVVQTNQPSEVEVRFSNGDNEARVRVRYEDGQLNEETDD